MLDVIKHKMKVANCKHGVFDESTIATVLKEVLKGLEYFHSNGQIHRYCCINIEQMYSYVTIRNNLFAGRSTYFLLAELNILLMCIELYSS